MPRSRGALNRGPARAGMKRTRPRLSRADREIGQGRRGAAREVGYGHFRRHQCVSGKFLVGFLARPRGSLRKDTEALLGFYDFPAEHWDHLRTSIPIESVLAEGRRRTVRPKGALSQKTAKLMVFTMVRAAAKKWRGLNGTNRLPRVIEAVKFTTGIAEGDANQSRAAGSGRVTQMRT